MRVAYDSTYRERITMTLVIDRPMRQVNVPDTVNRVVCAALDAVQFLDSRAQVHCTDYTSSVERQEPARDVYYEEERKELNARIHELEVKLQKVRNALHA